jgi:uncharacterized membrane protein
MKKNKNLELIITYLNLRVTADAIDTFFENHPAYPSMASITDAFNVWKIPNAAVGISPEQLSEINLPAIAPLTDNHVEFYVVIQQVTENSIQYYDTEKGLETLPINEFLQKWTGTALLFEPNANSGQDEYETAQKEVSQSNIVFNLQIFTALLLVAISAYSLFAEPPLLVTLHQCFSIFGLGLSVALLLIEYSNNTDITKKLCEVKATVSCEDIVKNKEAKLFGWLGYAEIGLVYFASFVLVAFYYFVNQNLHISHHYVSLLALSFIPFSIYYQSQIAKKWCTLCLYVQGVLLVQGGFSFFYLQNSHWVIPQAKDILASITAFLVVGSVWFFVKKILNENAKLRVHVKKLNKLRFEPSFFTNWLMVRPTIDFTQTPQEIVFGDSNAYNTLLLVLNPLCGSCLDTLKTGLSLWKTYPENLKLIVRMLGETEHHELFITHLLDQYDSSNLEQKMLFHFKNRDYDTFMKHYDKSQFGRNNETFLLHEKWAEENQITKTPVVFFNNVQIENPFEIEDLVHYIPVFSEEGILI